MKRRYRESTPLEQRDDYKAWKKTSDEEEAKSSKEKFKNELNARNVSIYKAWVELVKGLYRTRYFSLFGDDDEGFLEFCQEENPYLCQTGYYDSFSFFTRGFDINDTRTTGLGIGVYYKNGSEAGGDVFDEFIPQLKKAGGAELLITCALGVDSSELEGLTSEKQQLNMFTKYLINTEGCSRKQISSVIDFLKEIIDGNGIKYFPGSESVGYYGLEDGRPSVLVRYSVSVSPTKEEINNIIDCVGTLSREMTVPLC